MKLAKRIGMNKAKVAIARKIAVILLRLGRRNIVRLGTGKDSLIISCEILARFSTGRRCPAGSVVVATSVNRLVAARPHSADTLRRPTRTSS
jgi:hypothetical protein